MIVRMLRTVGRGGEVFRSGSTHEVPRDLAAEWQAAGIARMVAPATEGVVDTMDRQPRRNTMARVRGLVNRLAGRGQKGSG